jgi:FKBP-type peptidyl-prolyl cis-trans isomerase (trigger factor)
MAALKNQDIKPITYPRISLKTVEPNSDLTFEAEVALQPEVKLNKYQDVIKTAAAKSKIWIPGKGNPDPKKEDPNKTADDKLKVVFDTLLSTCEVEVPQMLIEDEVNRQLTKLLQQVQALKLDIHDYLKSIGKTESSIREDYTKTATETLKLEFILQAVVEDMKIEVPDKEIDELIASVPDEKARLNLQNPAEKANIKAILSRRKAVESLEKLIA